MKKEVKIILHIDLNAFYATVSEINEPHLKNKVFVVGGSPISGRGVITTASYNARRLGIKSGMSITEATRIYPKLSIAPINFPEYRKYSNLFFNFLTTYTDKIIKGSIDEAYLDITDLCVGRTGLDVAKEIQDKLLKLYKLPVSIGIAPTLFLAKMASDLKKPLGITVVRRRDIINKIFPLPIKDLFGMGIKTYPLMEAIGVNTIGDFVLDKNKEKILDIIKQNSYDSFVNHILGNSSDIIDPSKYDIPQSISNENTFTLPISNIDLLLQGINDLFDVTHNRLIKGKFYAKTVTIKLRTDEFKTITRSKTLIDYTSDYDELLSMAHTLFYDNFNDEAIRLIGVGVSNIIPKESYTEDYNLFTYQKLLEE